MTYEREFTAAWQEGQRRVKLFLMRRPISSCAAVLAMKKKKKLKPAEATRKLNAMLAEGTLKVVGKTKAGGRILAINYGRFFT